MKKLVVIEGLDGSGKATQTDLLCVALRDTYSADAAERIPVRQVSFPDYASDSSALVRMYLQGQFGTHPEDVNAYAASSFYAVDRYASYKKDWKKDYEEGIIIADRYTTSNAVHQCSKLDKSLWDSYLDWLFDLEYKRLGIPEPDLVVYLSVDPEVSQRLLTERYEGREEQKDIHEKDRGYLERCREAAEYCRDRLGWKNVECCRDGQMRSVEEIHEEIMNLLRKELGQRNYGLRS